MKTRSLLLLTVLILLGLIGAQVLNAQETLTAEPVERTLIIKKALEGIEGKDMHAWVTEFAPDVSTGKHHHPWHEFVYVLEGDFTIEVQGEPAVTLKPGEIITLAPKQVHEGKSSPNSPTKVLVFGLAPKDEPLVVQVE